ncbi:hypothetical protein ACIRPT_01720 [Streptomyces sp. NPDC101227]
MSGDDARRRGRRPVRALTPTGTAERPRVHRVQRVLSAVRAVAARR